MSKNAKRKVRSVRKHRKTAKKVMRGGGVIWSQDFSVVDKSPGNAEPKKKFFKLSVSTPLGAAMRKKKFEIKLEFDLNVDTEEKSVRDATVQLAQERKLYEEIPADLITLIINALSKHISDKSLQFPIVLPTYSLDVSPSMFRLYNIPNKVLVTKAHEHNLVTKTKLGVMQTLSKKLMHNFLDSDGNVTKPCVVHMSLRIEDGKMGLYLDDYTRIIETKLNEHDDVYEWEQKTIDKKLAVLEPNLTEVELKSKLDELKDKTDNDFIFYRVVHNIKQEEITLPVNVDVSSIPETGPESETATETNTAFIFKNGDKFVGKFKKINIGKLNMYPFKKAEWKDENGNPLEYCLILTDGTYTWKDGTVYKGSYINNLFSPGYFTVAKRPTPQFFKNKGTYRWPNGTTYEGYNGHFIIEFDEKVRGSVYFKNQDKVWSFGFNNGFLTKLPEVGTSPPEVGTSPP